MQKTVRPWLWAGLAFALVAWCATAFAQFSFLLPPSAPAPDPVTNAVTLYGKIDEDRATQVVADIQTANRLPTTAAIRLYINSGGGSVVAGNRIIQAMEASRRPIITIDVGMAASMAGLVYSYGDTRIQLPRTVIMFHDGYVGLEGSNDKVYSAVALYSAWDADFDNHLAKITGMSASQVHAKEAEDWWILPAEALANHLTDKVLPLDEYPAK